MSSSSIRRPPMSSRSRPPSHILNDDQSSHRARRLSGRPHAPQPQGRVVPPSRCRTSPVGKRFDLADVRQRRQRPAFPRRVDAGRRASKRRSHRRGGARRRPSSASRRSRSSRSPIRRNARTTHAKPSTPTISSAARRAPSKAPSSTSASFSMSRSIPTRATDTTACWSATRSSTTKPMRRSSSRRSSKRKPAPTCWRPPT